MVQVDVYGDARATCTQRVLILLEELDLKYDLKTVNLSKGEHKKPEFMELQPFGKVPAIKYDDRVVFESRSILRYIAKNNVEIKDFLGGTDVDIWLEVESQNYNPAVSSIVNEKLFKKWRGERPDMDVVKRSVEDLERVLDVYEKRLATVPFIAGEEFSIADISHIPYTNYIIKCGYKDLYKKRPNVYKWLKRIIKRESVQFLLNANEQENVKEDKHQEKEEKEDPNQK
jgi:glutathione S-transferase